MGSFSSGLAIGLSFVFGFILMGLVAEVYYMLWWKKRITYNTSTNPENEEESCFVFSWKKVCFTNPEEQAAAAPLDLEMGLDKENLKNFGEEGIESEIMRMHNLCGPPRFLFTIKEESREDLMESEDGISRKGSRLSDFLLSSPPPTTVNVVSPDSSSNYTSSNHGFNNNPLFECLTEAEFNRFRSNSPPPSFKFLKDAEDKLIRKLLVEEAEKKRVVALKIQDSS